MPEKKRMSAAEFDELRPLLRISPERIAAARAALVDGETLQAIGARNSWSRQAAGDAVRVVWACALSYRKARQAGLMAGMLLPPGWEVVTLVAPSTLVDEFRRAIALANESQKE